MGATPVTAGVPEGLDRFLALTADSPETRGAVLALKGQYAARSEHEARLRSAREELQAAEIALAAHGHPLEPSAIVDEQVLLDMDLRFGRLKAVRGKFRDDKVA